MTPGKHGCVCVAIVLLVTVLGDGATPDATQGQHDKSVKSQETAVATKSDKGSTSQKAPLTFGECDGIFRFCVLRILQVSSSTSARLDSTDISENGTVSIDF